MKQKQKTRKKQKVQHNVTSRKVTSQISDKEPCHSYLEGQGIIGNHGVLRNYDYNFIKAKLTNCAPKENELDIRKIESVATQMPEQQTEPIHWGQTERIADYSQVQTQHWGSKASVEDIDCCDSPWSRSSPQRVFSESGEGQSWNASSANHAITQPRPVSWRRNQESSGEGATEMIDEAIVAPVQKPLKFVQNVSTFNSRRLGWTFHPQNFKAPNFDFKTINMASVGILAVLAKKPSWYALPKLTRSAYEGDSKSYYVGAGLHKTTLKEGGKPVYWRMSGAMATQDRNAELEHSNDHKHAYKISLKEADEVLTKHVVGKRFGPKPTKAAVEQMVLDKIKAKLTHPQLGSDKTKWGAKYRMLFLKTLSRDTKGWHTFGLGNRTEIKDKKGKLIKVIYKVNKGTTKINKVTSAKLIKY
jgi:hypothetical protein